MSSEDVMTIIVAAAAVIAVVGLATGVGSRIVTGLLLVLVTFALLYGWSTDPSYELNKPIAVLAAVVAVAGGGLVTTQVFSYVEDPERVRQAGAVLRGGAWIGALERLAVYVALVAGWAPGLAIVLAVKGLGRYPELRNQEDTGVAERFIIGTFTSVLWAVACAGVALVAP
jgi:hypothetical protein